MRRVSDCIESTTVFPVFKTDFKGRLTFSNLSAIPVLNEWDCYGRREISERMLHACPELAKFYEDPEPGSLMIFYKGYALSFVVKPFPERGYIGFYGFQIRFIDKYDHLKQFPN